ncbi:MAG: hypothetical protein ABI861_10035 [Panacibacter sp.]
MEEHKKLHSLLTKYALQEPSSGFDDSVMQLIIASKIKHTASSVNPLLKRVLVVVFIIVAAAMMITAFFIQPNALVTYISISLPSGTYVQLFSFFLSFWVVMLLNFWWNKRNAWI